MVLAHCAEAVFPNTKRSFHSASVLIATGTFGIPWPYLAMKEGRCDGTGLMIVQDVIKLQFELVKSKL